MEGINITNFLKYLFAYYYIDTGEREVYRTWVQKILWFTHWKFYRMYQIPFFSENFQSYKYGPISWTVLQTQFFGIESFKNSQYNIDEILDFHQNNLVDEFKNRLKEDFLNDFNEDFGETFDENQIKGDLDLRWSCFVFVFEKLKKFRPKDLINLSHSQKSFKIAAKNPHSKVIFNETILDDEEISILES
ncbi:hypothetical protein EHI52_00070 [Mesomycoplasma hyopneumoniae]|uniref:Antitoxin SocA-like Panacea domain-containing protein n=1 Tax=Mesomycoplasma hyopneumoniae (strain J / ATCC 25934 / NCTC 10110) TaxID=262719 RepID=Q4AAU2_MESHJ|nr:Panacea domain-containing protein [Mesomycoplasma hyopneumoniae]AAZ44101.2 hypothetical protein MHJ_0007 [Mesomycoplasma hyopneumoniae J]AGQ50617.1 hypothetical protein MHL_2671 [Mesomycoplasma hyopneumoniae 7422]MXR10073.1 DUF4065 domain-containing protein [Mesomycoplasma hyopneumoniae]MXR12763.1 DUF4065 domain-containing protein [Mesomycoplasma hyopneumoniae]MXR33857.1 DUF4065 domain-containing protein [Mesomycoplasma hyopneumoniae]